MNKDSLSQLDDSDTINVLFVCTGNICRSPTAEGVLKKIVLDKNTSHKFIVDSAGTSAYHVGQHPDKRSSAEADKNGIDITNQKARQILEIDYDIFHYIIAMDDSHYDILKFDAPLKQKNKIFKFIDFVPGCKYSGVPDPYYGADNGFPEVFEIIEIGCNNLYDKISNSKLKNN